MNISTVLRSHASLAKKFHWAMPRIKRTYSNMCKKGYLQSPVDISSQEVEQTQLPPLCFINHFGDCAKFTMFQDRNTVNLTGGSDDGPIALQGGPLKGKFILGEIVFHWGSNNSNGSEHSLDQTKYAMEAQIMYYNEIYGCLSGAFNQPDGVAIIGLLMNASETANNPGFDQMTECLSYLNCPGAKVPLTTNVLKIFKCILDTQEYYSYEGSITKPPCCEEVRWMVFKDVIDISKCNVEPFRNLCDQNGNKIDCNSRNLQQLNGRTIHAIKSDKEPEKKDKNGKKKNDCSKC